MLDRRKLLVLLAGAILLAPVAAIAKKERKDHADEAELARRAVEKGEILPLAEILRRLEGKLDGRVIEVELEHDDGRLVYELKTVNDRGQIVEVEIDPATAEILKTSVKKKK